MQDNHAGPLPRVKSSVRRAFLPMSNGVERRRDDLQSGDLRISLWSVIRLCLPSIAPRKAPSPEGYIVACVTVHLQQAAKARQMQRAGDRAADGRHIWTPEPGRPWPRSAGRPRLVAPARGLARRRPRKSGRHIWVAG
jgi:hypothetical protein